MLYSWRPNRGVTFNKWKPCGVCGFEWPEKALKPQRGVLACPECIDEPSHEDYVRESELKEHEKTIHPWEAD